MVHVIRLVLLLLASMQFAQVAGAASPAYPLEGLLPRAETVFIGRVIKQDDKTVSFAVTEYLRGQEENEFAFKFAGELAYQTRLAQNTQYFIISQGDNHFGKPEPIITLGQGTKGQAGYCGWIMFPIKTEGEQIFLERIASRSASGRLAVVTLDHARKLVEQVLYNPDIYGKKQAKMTS